MVTELHKAGRPIPDSDILKLQNDDGDDEVMPTAAHMNVNLTLLNLTVFHVTSPPFPCINVVLSSSASLRYILDMVS